MKTQNAINALRRSGFQVSKDERLSRYYASKQTTNYRVSFHDQDGEAICICVKRFDAQDEIQSDYFAGVYPVNLKTAIRIAESV